MEWLIEDIRKNNRDHWGLSAPGSDFEGRLNPQQVTATTPDRRTDQIRHRPVAVLYRMVMETISVPMV